MTFGPDLEVLLQGALDDTLTPEERETLDRLMSENVEVQGRAAHLKQLMELLESVGPVEPPATLVQGVVARISPKQPRGGVAAFPASPARSVRLSFHKKGTAINKSILLGLAAAAVLVIAVLTWTGYPPATDGTEMTIGAARRAQGPPIDAKDLVPGDTPAQQFLQSDTFARLLKDPASLNVLSDAGLLAALQNSAFAVALSDARLGAALQSEVFRQALNSNGFSAALQTERFAEAMATAARRAQ